MLSPKPPVKKFSLLSIFAWAFGCLVALRNGLYDLGFLRAKRLPGRVISVGNIAVGGTGKSPVVVAIARELISKGIDCAVLTRGYRGGLKRCEWVVIQNGVKTCGKTDESVKPDEAIMQSQMLPEVPVVVGARRYLAAKEWLNECRRQLRKPPQVWILDDGFQHRKIARDLDVVLLDAKEPFGPLLPQAHFRESPESLGRADVILFTRADTQFPLPGDFAFPSLISPHAVVSRCEFKTGKPRCVFSTNGEQSPREFFLIAGIARPENFKRSCLDQGLICTGEHFVADHKNFDLNDLQTILTNRQEPILTTAKDWARSAADLKLLGRSVYVIPLTCELPAVISQRISPKIGSA